LTNKSTEKKKTITNQIPPQPDKNITINLDFENFKGRELKKITSTEYFFRIMVPPGLRKFFFMIDG